MKSTVLVYILLFVTGFVKAELHSTIHGRVSDQETEVVFLLKVYNGSLQVVTTSTLDQSGSFTFDFVPEYAGIYCIGSGTHGGIHGLERFYFAGNEKLNVELIKGGYVLFGANTKENEALFKWDQEIRDIRGMATASNKPVDSDRFLTKAKALKGKLASLINICKVGEDHFDTLLEKLIRHDFTFYTYTYFYGLGASHSDKGKSMAFFSDSDLNHFLTSDLLRFPYGTNFLKVLMDSKFGTGTIVSLEERLKEIPSDILKGQYVLQYMESLHSAAEFNETKQRYWSYLIHDDQRQKAEKIGQAILSNKSENSGEPAFPFCFEDVKGNKVSLSDMRGSLVLLDFWATWCGPCRSQEPYWAGLIERYKDQAVIFCGISIDEHKSKWETYVKDKNLKGIQLYAGTPNPLTEAYKVVGIPRYILIDKKGNLISDHCPTPVDVKLAQLIEDWLKK